jgi:hypothetical protein
MIVSFIREDFFLGGSFRDLKDLNRQLRHWLDTVANPRLHATTKRVVNEAFAEEKRFLLPLPLTPYRAVLKLERRVSHEGLISVGGNLYSVPDTTRRRILDVHVLADELQIFEGRTLIAVHPSLEGRDQCRIDPAHRRAVAASHRRTATGSIALPRAGDVVARRSLEFYDAVARRMANPGGAR